MTFDFARANPLLNHPGAHNDSLRHSADASLRRFLPASLPGFPSYNSSAMCPALTTRHRGFSLLEAAIALIIIAVLLAILVPSLSAARSASFRERCLQNQAVIGKAWFAYLEDHNKKFPIIASQPAWQWGGVRFSAINNEPHIDFQRPISPYVGAPSDDQSAANVFRCPADRGIVTSAGESATGGRSAFRSFGTSFRANGFLTSGTLIPSDKGSILQPIDRNMLLSAPASLVLCGDAAWYEQRYSTGRQAHWHGSDGKCNLLFLDGSVRQREVLPMDVPTPMAFEPVFATDHENPPAPER